MLKITLTVTVTLTLTYTRPRMFDRLRRRNNSHCVYTAGRATSHTQAYGGISPADISATIFVAQGLLHSTWTELNCNESTQLHDAFVGHVRQRRDLTGCSETGAASAQRVPNTRSLQCAVQTEVGGLQFSLVCVLRTDLNWSAVPCSPTIVMSAEPIVPLDYAEYVGKMSALKPVCYKIRRI